MKLWLFESDTHIHVRVALYANTIEEAVELLRSNYKNGGGGIDWDSDWSIKEYDIAKDGLIVLSDFRAG